jgi:hypothetical protein
MSEERPQPVGANEPHATEWDFAFALYNLRLPLSDNPLDRWTWPDGIDLATGTVAIVSGDDPRVAAIRAERNEVEAILSSFRNYSGERYTPAVLITRRDAPESVTRDLTALLSFRNAVALSFVLRGRAAGAKGSVGDAPTWTDTFDFHPLQVSRSGRPVVQSPALLDLIRTEKPANFSPSPHTGVHTARRLWCDGYLYPTLGSEWKRCYLSPAQDDAYGRALFRSLEIAYQASSLGGKTHHSMHDFGVQIALWVSAMEILAGPKADAKRVVALLGNATLPPRFRKQRFTSRVLGEERSDLNIYQFIYAALNRTRNDFLHGNPVTWESLKATAGDKTAALPRLAGVLYRSALVSYLERSYPRQLETWDDLLLIEDLTADWPYNDAWKALFSPEDDSGGDQDDEEDDED